MQHDFSGEIDVSVMTIRAALPADPADLAFLQSVAAGMGHSHAVDYFPRCLAEQVAATRHVYLAAFPDGRAAGYVQLNLKPVYVPFRRLNIPEIQDLCVLPSARRQGLGEKLVRHCENIARHAGYTDMGISVGLHAGFGQAQRLYVRLGYVPDGCGVAYDDDTINTGDLKPVDDLLTLKLIKTL